MAGRRERPLDPKAGPVEQFAHELRELRAAAGGLTYREMAVRACYSVSTLAAAARGDELPSMPVALAYASVCGGDPAEWEARWRATAQALDEQTSVSMVDDDQTTAPYRGLTRYESEDRTVFFGRTELADQLHSMLASHRLVILTGASGSGKSSLLRAGLIPALQQTGRTSLRCSAIRVITPGPRPATTHAQALTGVFNLTETSATRPGDGELQRDTVILVDQFEEVFTLCQDSAERARFLDLLLAGRNHGSGLRVVIAVRADFYTHCTGHPGLVEILGTAHLVVGPMSANELRRAVVGPARVAGLIVERELTALIVEETAAEPGGLPLMSHALLEVWRRRRGRTLTLAAYEAIGGIHGAVASTAEHTYNQLTPDQRDQARRIMMRLITPGQGTQDTRRPTPWTELQATHTQDAQTVLEHLTRARLITLDDQTVDLAHEALITAWPRLRTWIDEDRHRLRLHRALTHAADSWHDLGRDTGALYRGVRLAETYETFHTRARTGELTSVENEFLAASHSSQQTAARRTRHINMILACMLALALVAAGVAFWQRQIALTAQKTAIAAQQMALSRQLAAQSTALLQTDPDLASLLAVQAYRTSPTAEATVGLHRAAALPLQHRFTGHTGGASSAVFSPDGRT
ncbi:helix-turn-helix domain-containing protein, partial [Streptomyces sp. NPDC005963]|uniref:nSTAND1 domain-containing NTPase n=1 Tax=Streptomyces sp. NPDC005963 TaxID=3156721 RepID=UPI0033D40199